MMRLRPLVELDDFRRDSVAALKRALDVLVKPRQTIGQTPQLHRDGSAGARKRCSERNCQFAA